AGGHGRRDERGQKRGDSRRGQSGRDSRDGVTTVGGVATAESVHLQVDESGRQQLSVLEEDLLVRALGRRSRAGPRDDGAVRQDTIHPRQAVHMAAEERLHGRVLSPRAAARSPWCSWSRAAASSALSLQRSISTAALALPFAATSVISASAAGTPVRS